MKLTGLFKCSGASEGHKSATEEIFKDADVNIILCTQGSVYLVNIVNPSIMHPHRIFTRLEMKLLQLEQDRACTVGPRTRF